MVAFTISLEILIGLSLPVLKIGLITIAFENDLIPLLLKVILAMIVNILCFMGLTRLFNRVNRDLPKVVDKTWISNGVNMVSSFIVVIDALVTFFMFWVICAAGIYYLIGLN